MSTENLAFIDIETTGLNWETSVPWEVGIIDIDGNVLFHQMWKPESWEMANAESMALTMTDFYSRMTDPATANLRGHDADYNAARIAQALNKKVLCGAAVHFDMLMLDKFLRLRGQCPTWSHRVLDVQTYVAGVYGHAQGASLGATADRAGVAYDKTQKHTALYDAWLAREAYSAALKQGTGEGLRPVKFEDLGIRAPSSAPRPPSMGVAPPMGLASKGPLRSGKE